MMMFHQHSIKVFQITKWLLLQIASPDVIIRGVRQFQDVYLIAQEHSSLAELINRIKPGISGSLLLQVIIALE